MDQSNIPQFTNEKTGQGRKNEEEKRAVLVIKSLIEKAYLDGKRGRERRTVVRTSTGQDGWICFGGSSQIWANIWGMDGSIVVI